MHSLVPVPVKDCLLCRHKHPLPYALVTQEFAMRLESVQDATRLKQEGAEGQSLRQSIQKLSEDVMENWPTVSQDNSA